MVHSGNMIFSPMVIRSLLRPAGMLVSDDIEGLKKARFGLPKLDPAGIISIPKWAITIALAIF